MASEDVKIVVGAENRVTATLRQIQGDVEKFASTTRTLATAVAGAFAIDRVVDFARSSVTEFAKAEQAQIKLQSVLRATGNTTKLSQQQIEDFAQSIQNATGTEAEEVLDAASQLGRMSGIAGDQFKEILSLANDMKTVLGGDMTSAAMMLAKALNSPAEGMSKLARSGVLFTEFQKETIKYLDETGKKAEAQAEILKEVRRQFGGAGTDFGDTTAGSITKLSNAIGDLKEAIGQVLSPAIRDAVTLIRGVVPAAGPDPGSESKLRHPGRNTSAVERNEFYVSEVNRLAKLRAVLETQAVQNRMTMDNWLGSDGLFFGFDTFGYKAESERLKTQIDFADQALRHAQMNIDREVQSQTRNGGNASNIFDALQRAAMNGGGNAFGGISSLFQGSNVGSVKIPSIAESGAAIMLNGALGQWSPFAIQKQQEEQRKEREKERRDNLPALAATEARFLQRGRGLLDPAAAAANKQIALLERIDSTLRRIENGDVILAAEAIG